MLIVAANFEGKGDTEIVLDDENQNLGHSDSYCATRSFASSQKSGKNGLLCRTRQGVPRSPYLGKMISEAGADQLKEQASLGNESTGEVKNGLTENKNFNSCESDFIDSESRVDSLQLQTDDEPEGQEIPNTGKTASTSRQATVQYVDENPGELLEYNPILDNSYYSDFTANVDLGKFLSRPVLIQTLNWAENASCNVSFFPWALYFNEPSIRKKLDNYSLLSCNLNLKVMINASPFYYGMLYVSYEPLPTFTTQSIVSTGGYSGNLVPFSQRPHICVYPQANKGGEMKLPFFYHKNWLRVSSYNDFVNMGMVNLVTYVNLFNANSVSSGGCTIQIYAWASDVRLAGATANLSLQAKDEYSKEHTGPISAPASAIAEATGLLGKVPIIGNYMTATSMAARTVGDIAAWFGYTNTPNIAGSTPMKNTPFHAFASTEISTPIEKLSIDPKNELTIDPRVAGLAPVDEMIINKFVQRQSWIYNSMWNATDGVDTILFKSLVLPEMIVVDGTGAGVVRQATPLAHVALMFSFWRGDIIFRFRFICTKFHRGRVRITWDPEGDIITNTSTSSVAFTRIVDISQECDVEVRVPYLQAVSWLQCVTAQSSSLFGSGSGTMTHDPLSDNGSIVMRVFTQQTSPVASSPIYVAVSVHAAENVEFAAPRDLPDNLSPFVVQSQDEMEYDHPVNVDAGDTNGAGDPNRYLVNFGESIQSFRQVLRRSCYVQTVIAGAASTGNKRQTINKYTIGRLPPSYGYDPNGPYALPGIVVPASNFKTNIVKNIPFNHLAGCFIGYRGSVIWHVNTDTPQPCSTIEVVRRRTPHTSTALLVSTYLPDTASAALLASYNCANRHAGFSGMALSNQNTQTGLSILLPMYSQYRFNTTDPDVSVAGASYDGSDKDAFSVIVVSKPGFNTAVSPETAMSLNLYFSVGTDFSFHFFLNVPSLYSYTLPTPAL